MPTNMVIFVEIVECYQVRTVTEKLKFRDGQITDIWVYIHYNYLCIRALKPRPFCQELEKSEMATLLKLLKLFN